MSLTQLDMYKAFQASNPEVFNHEFINQRESEDDLINDLLSNISKAIESIEGIEFLGVETEFDESKFAPGYREIRESRYFQSTLRFRLTGDVTKEGGGIETMTKEVSVPLLFPKRINRFFYQLGGNWYYAIYQMVDKGAYAVGSALSLKTLLMPLILHKKSTNDIVDSEGNTIIQNCQAIYLDIFKNKINILFYFLAEMGWDRCIEFLGLKNEIFVNEEPKTTIIHKYHKLLMGKNTLWLAKDLSQQNLNLVCTVLDLFTGTKLKEFDKAREYWVTHLGKMYTTTATQYEKKGEKLLISLRRILDGQTKTNLVHIDPKDKKDIFHLIRWMAIFYDELHAEDTVDLASKRLRLTEYLIYPLLRKLSDETYRILNSRRIMLHHLESVFSNIHPKFIVEKLVTNKLLRYVNCVNRIDLFSSALKLTMTGPQGLDSSSGSDINLKYRGQHESFIGKIGLFASSAGDPGLTMTMTPFNEPGHYFDTEIKYKTPDRYKGF